LLFAHPREVIGASCVTVINARTVSDVRRELSRQYPALASLLPSCAFAVGESIVPRGDEDSALCGDAEVALIPAVSGG
jgi:molybdopterin converting factor small subunit